MEKAKHHITCVVTGPANYFLVKYKLIQDRHILVKSFPDFHMLKISLHKMDAGGGCKNTHFTKSIWFL
jgi:hypothetical protein